jgi:hypothetical protein
MALKKRKGQALVAHGRPAKGEIRGFLGLPGELRNIIYAHYFEDEFRAELAPSGAIFDRLTPRTVTLCVPPSHHQYVPKSLESGPRTVRISRLLGRYKRIDGFRTKWTTSLSALILVCKKVYYETIKLLYRNTKFVFHSSRRILNFLDCVPAVNLSYITRLHLHYVPYGEPAVTSMRAYQEKHIKSWDMACKALAERLINLRELDIAVQFSMHHYFSLGHAFLQPLYRFRTRQIAQSQSISSECTEETSIPSGGIESVKAQISTLESRCLSGPKPMRAAMLELHGLFNITVSRFILGWSELDAFADLDRAFNRADPDGVIARLRYLDQRYL